MLDIRHRWALNSVKDMKATETSTANEANQSETDNLTVEGLTSLLMQGSEPEAPELPESEAEEAEEAAPENLEEVEDFEPETEDSTEEAVESEEYEEEEVPETEEAGEIDLTALSPEEIQDLAKRGKSRLLDRIGELTAKNKAFEAKFAEMEASQPVKREIPQDQNPFRELKSFDEIREKWTEVEQTLEQTDILLDDHEDYGPDDVITVGSQEFTKRQLRQANRNARDAVNKFLPAQAEQLKKQESYTQATEHWNQQAAKEVPEIQDEESDFGKEYQKLVSSPGVAKFREAAPEYAVDVGYIMAHALRSIKGQIKPKVPKGAGKKLKVKPPASPVGAGAARQGAKPSSPIEDLKANFERTGSESDFVAYQTAKMLNQQ
jgi:hypothetical protein